MRPGYLDDPVGRDRHRRHITWLMVVGALSLLGGLFGLLMPAAFAVAISVVIGVLFLSYGILRLLAAVLGGSHASGWLAALLGIAVGLMLLIRPVEGSVALATLVAVFLLLEGVFELWAAFHYRAMFRWGWLVASGVLSLVLGLIALTGWPALTITLLGVIVSVNFLFHGAFLLALGWNAPGLASE